MENNQEQPEFGMEHLREHWLYRFLQVVVLIMTGIFGGLIMGLLASMLSTLIWPIEFADLQNIELMKTNVHHVYATQLIQAFFALGAFVFPVMYTALREQESFLDYAGLKAKPRLIPILVAIFLAFLAMPPVNALAEYLYTLSLPEQYKEFEESFRQTQQNLLEMQAIMMKGDGIFNFVLNTLIVAVIPAFAEELFFRRALPNQLFTVSRSAHFSVWVSAILFGLVHSSFYNLASIILFGLLLGYLVLWTGNIWIPIIAHFTNNFISLILYKLGNGEGEESAMSYPSWVLALCILGVFALLWYLYRSYRQRMA